MGRLHPEKHKYLKLLEFSRGRSGYPTRISRWILNRFPELTDTRSVYQPDSNEEKSAAERAFERTDVRAELDRLDQMLEELKVQYEQHFSGILPLAPDKLHNEVKRLRRLLLKAPFKNSEMKYRYKSLENRYHTYRSYWERVNREREAGTYQRDVFKANLRERIALEEQHATTAEGKAEGHLSSLFKSYKDALEKSAGRKMNVDYEAFKKMVVKRAKEFKEKHGTKKLTFKIVMKEGKVSIQAKAKE